MDEGKHAKSVQSSSARIMIKHAKHRCSVDQTRVGEKCKKTGLDVKRVMIVASTIGSVEK